MALNVGLRYPDKVTEEGLTFIKQLGVKNVILGAYLGNPELPGETQWEFTDLLQLRMKFEDAGLKLIGIENFPFHFYNKVLLGLPGRDEQIEHLRTTLSNMGRAGINMLGYHFMPCLVWRTSQTTRGRGGALVTSFDLELVRNAPLTYGQEYSEAEMWANYEYFIRAILPVAEEYGVRLALHPDDPPVESLGGIPRIFRDFDGFKRAMDIGDSPMHGLEFCVGTWSEMGLESGVLEAIRYFGARQKLFYVHFRDVQGAVPAFRECFIDEGNCDVFQVMRTLKEVGFEGTMVPDHEPRMVGDTEWRHRAVAHSIGYMQGLVRAVAGV